MSADQDFQGVTLERDLLKSATKRDEKESPSNKDSLSLFSDRNKMRDRDAELGRKGDFDEQREQLIKKSQCQRDEF